MPLSLLILALSAFAIGTTEFVIMGLLPDVAADLGVSIPAPAGWSPGTPWAWPSVRRSWRWPLRSCRARPRWWR